MNILVTGGLGFVGTNLIPYLEKDSAIRQVVILDSLCYTANLQVLEGLSGKFTFIEGDIRNAELITEFVQASDLVINLAAQAFVDNSINDCRPFVETNISGTLNILEAIRHNGCRQRLIHSSTDEVWGEILHGAFNEESPYMPRNPYAATKAAADHLIRSFGVTYGLNYNIVHFTNLYGRWMYPERLIPKTIIRLMKGEKIGLYGNGQQVRTWLHVDDAVGAVMKIIRGAYAQESFALGAIGEYTNLDVVRLIGKLLGKDDDCIEYIQDRPGHDFRYAVSGEKISRALNWNPTITFEDGIADLISWFGNHNQEWEAPIPVNG